MAIARIQRHRNTAFVRCLLLCSDDSIDILQERAADFRFYPPQMALCFTACAPFHHRVSTFSIFVRTGGYCKEYAKGKRPIGVMLEDTWFLRSVRAQFSITGLFIK
jgi:hypothetical protein